MWVKALITNKFNAVSEQFKKAAQSLTAKEGYLDAERPLQSSGMKAKSVQPKRGLSLRSLNKNKDENKTNEVETSSKITPEGLNAFVMLNRIPNVIGKKDI